VENVPANDLFGHTENAALLIGPIQSLIIHTLWEVAFPIIDPSTFNLIGKVQKEASGPLLRMLIFQHIKINT
jgi:hypothetical protein